MTIADLLVGKRVRATRPIGSVNKGDVVTIAEGAWICVDNSYELLDEIHFVPEEHKHRYNCVNCNTEELPDKTEDIPKKKQKPSESIKEIAISYIHSSTDDFNILKHEVQAILDYLDKQAEL